MSDEHDFGNGVTGQVFASVRDLPREILWQEVVNQFAKTFVDLDMKYVVHKLAKDSSGCIMPDDGAIMWSGSVHPEMPTVNIGIRGPTEERPDCAWICSIDFSSESVWQLTQESCYAMMTTGARLLALRTFIDDLNDRKAEIARHEGPDLLSFWSEPSSPEGAPSGGSGGYGPS